MIYLMTFFFVPKKNNQKKILHISNEFNIRQIFKFKKIEMFIKKRTTILKYGGLFFMKENFKFVDEAIVGGRIAGIKHVEGKEMTTVTLASRTSKKKTDFPMILLFKENQKLIEGYNVGDFVEFRGFYESRRKNLVTEEGKDDNKYIITQAFVGTEISPIKSIEEEYAGVSGKTFAGQFKNVVLISGTFNRAKKFSDTRVGLNIYVLKNNIPNRIMITVFCSNADDFISKFEKGDKLFITGSIQTLPAIEGKRRKESIVAKKIERYEE